MSYGIVRVQKFKAGSVKGIEIHDKREKDHSHTNKEIIWERSKQNYDLNPTDGTFRQSIKKRIDELTLPRAVRKDAVVMAQVLVTSDRAFFDKLSSEQTKQFFKQSYDFLKDRYGEKNIISSVVHMDEKTPHMHFNFVPVTEDGRLSAKSILNRMDLIKQHDDFYKEIGREWGLSRGEKEGYKKHIETAELKKQTAYKELEDVEIQNKELRAKNDDLKREKKDLAVTISKTKADLEVVKNEISSKEDENFFLELKNDDLKSENDDLRGEKEKLVSKVALSGAMLKSLKNEISDSRGKISTLQIKHDGLTSKIDDLRGEKEKVVSEVALSETTLKSLKNEISDSRGKISTLQIKHDGLTSKIDDLRGEKEKLVSEVDLVKNQLKTASNYLNNNFSLFIKDVESFHLDAVKLLSDPLALLDRIEEINNEIQKTYVKILGYSSFVNPELHEIKAWQSSVEKIPEYVNEVNVSYQEAIDHLEDVHCQISVFEKDAIQKKLEIKKLDLERKTRSQKNILDNLKKITDPEKTNELRAKKEKVISDFHEEIKPIEKPEKAKLEKVSELINSVHDQTIELKTQLEEKNKETETVIEKIKSNEISDENLEEFIEPYQGDSSWDLEV